MNAPDPSGYTGADTGVNTTISTQPSMPSWIGAALTTKDVLLRASESDIQTLRGVLGLHAQTSTEDPNEPSSIYQSIVLAWSESGLLLYTFLAAFQSDLAPSLVAMQYRFSFAFSVESPGHIFYTRGRRSFVESGPFETTEPKALEPIQAEIYESLRECSPLIGEGHIVYAPWLHSPWDHIPWKQRDYRCSIWRFKLEDRSFVCEFLLHV